MTSHLTKYRDELSCYNAWSDARTPGLNDPPCSNNDTATNSCYNIGEKDGNDLAAKYINICYELNDIPNPPGKYSKEYVEGWNNGISDANAAASNDDNVRSNVTIIQSRSVVDQVQCHSLLPFLILCM
jgi:hypothetical protein